METKRIKLELKEADTGSVSSLFATLNVIDNDNDVIVPGAFSSQPVVLSDWQHSSWSTNSPNRPVGKGYIREDGDRAIFDGKFFMDTVHGQEMYKTARGLGDIMEWSFGFNIIDSSTGLWEGEPVRFLKRLDVVEVSPVLRGAGIGTRTLDMKNANKQDCDTCGDDDLKGSSLGELVTRLRTRRGLTDESLGERAGIAPLSLERIMNGEMRCPNAGRLRRLAATLGVSMTRLREAAERDGCTYMRGWRSTAGDIIDEINDMVETAPADDESWKTELLEVQAYLESKMSGDTTTKSETADSAPVTAQQVQEIIAQAVAESHSSLMASIEERLTGTPDEDTAPTDDEGESEKSDDNVIGTAYLRVALDSEDLDRQLAELASKVANITISSADPDTSVIAKAEDEESEQEESDEPEAPESDEPEIRSVADLEERRQKLAALTS